MARFFFICGNVIKHVATLFWLDTIAVLYFLPVVPKTAAPLFVFDAGRIQKSSLLIFLYSDVNSSILKHVIT